MEHALQQVAAPQAAVFVGLHELADQVVLVRGEPVDVLVQLGVDHVSGSSLTVMQPPRDAL